MHRHVPSARPDINAAIHLTPRLALPGPIVLLARYVTHRFYEPRKLVFGVSDLDPVVQSIVSLMISLRHKFVKQISTKATNTLLFVFFEKM